VFYLNKKLIIGISVVFLLLASFASAKEVEVNFFYSPSCGYCAQEKVFLNEIEQNYSEVKINRFSVASKENVDKLLNLYERHDFPKENYGLVPVTFIDGQYFLGFSDQIGQRIEKCIIDISQGRDPECKENNPAETSDADIVKIPILGEISAKDYSLPALSVILGVLDGFNVCSLGALVLILGLVLALKSRKRILAFGSIFILTTAIIYGFLIVIWYQIFSFLSPYLRIMEIIIGALGIGGGIYFLKEFLRMKKKGVTCEIDTGKEIMSKFSSRFQEGLKNSRNILVLIGLVFTFAAIITIVEFPCSAAVPVFFAGVLAKAELSTFYYLLYISLFVLFYMIDEILVFLIAFFTMKLWLASNKVVIWITLIEAIILFFLGLYYILGFGVIV